MKKENNKQLYYVDVRNNSRVCSSMCNPTMHLLLDLVIEAMDGIVIDEISFKAMYSKLRQEISDKFKQLSDKHIEFGHITHADGESDDIKAVDITFPEGGIIRIYLLPIRKIQVMISYGME